MNAKAVVPLRWGYIRGERYFPTHRAGLFSICTTTLSDLNTEQSTRIAVVDASFTFEYYKPFPKFNVWPFLFSAPRPANAEDAEPVPGEIWKSVHDVYEALPLQSYRPLIRRYFTPSKLVLRKSRALKHHLRLGRGNGITLGMHVRATDKSTEIADTPLDRYLGAADEILAAHKEVSFVAMTDSLKVSRRIKEAFGSRVNIVSHLRMTDDSRGAHKSLPRISRLGEASGFLAAIHLISSLDHVVTHTGNGALWTALYRGSASNLVQFRAGKRFQS